MKITNEARITITLPNKIILNYTVDEYELIEGFIRFTDKKTGKIKTFPGSIAEIEEKGSDSFGN